MSRELLRRARAMGMSLWLVLLVPAGLRAADWPAQAAAGQLAQSREWLQLLHYTPAHLPGRYRNFVDDPAFFLAAEGSSNPAAELTATLAALLADPAAQCRFPGRRLWLTTQMPGLADDLPAATCPEYEEWRRVLAVREAVLVFAASYLNSPSSMYGHTFLRFDSGNPERMTPMLAWALNFGATIPPDENGFVYAYRGLFGGYPGRFAAGPYFEKLREYTRLESRDLWEYRLNLGPEELDRMLAHMWELRDVNFDYYFFDENCSLRLLELLDVARPGHDLADQFPNYAIPIDTVRAVIDAGMVTAVDYRPATRTVMRHDIAALGTAQRRLARRLVDDVQVANSPEFLQLPADQRRRVVSVAYSYLRDRATREPASQATLAQNFALLRLINDSAAADAAPLPPPRPVAPEEGHHTGLLSATVGMEENRAFGDAEWRLSYHDLLDPEPGYPAGASLNMGRLVLRFEEGGTLQLQQLDVLEITSLSPRNEFFSPWSWRVNAGLDRQWTGGDDVLTTQVNAGFGWTFAPVDALSLFTMLTGRIEYNHEMERSLDLAPGLAAGVRLQSVAGTTLLGADYYQFTDGVDRTLLNLRHSVSLTRNLALRLSLERNVTDTDRVDEASLGLRYYF
jgi:hypothetical protein